MGVNRVVGKNLPRLDAYEKVTGQAIYGFDFKLAGMLYGGLLRSPIPHGAILNLDTSKAGRLIGVKAVITGKDLPPGRYGYVIKDHLAMAREKVRFVGEPVAAVAAVDPDVAQEAISLISADYQPLEAVFDPEEALQPGSPIIHEELASYKHFPVYVRLVPGTNICNHFKLAKGDIEEGFSQSDVVLEETYRAQMVHHAYIEPHAALAWAVPSGRATVWTNTQAPFAVRQDISDALLLPLNSVRVIGTRVGGGFGGKIQARLEPVCLALSQRTGRPVKMTMTRTEEFAASAVRHPATIQVKTGAKKDGRLQGVRMKILWDTGAYSEHGPAVCRGAGYSASGPYEIPHVKVDSYCIYTNNPMGGAFRGFGLTQTAWALESQLDGLALHLGLDPLEIRLINSVVEGSISATGQKLTSVGMKECLARVTRAVDWPASSGKGLAAMYLFTRAFAPSCAFIKINEDGSVGLVVGAVDIGQGSDTILAQMAAEEMGVELEQVAVSPVDTDSTPYDVGTMSSRITYGVGNAIRLATADARQQLLRLAAKILEANPEDLVLQGGRAFVKGAPDRGMTLAEISALSHAFQNGPILGRGSFLDETVTPMDPETGQGAKPTEYWKYTAQAVKVDLDEETGQFSLSKLVAASDVGFAIHPRNVEGQIEGGVIMGLGGAVLEEMCLDKGRVVNPSFLDYNLPTALDAPRVDSIIVETPHEEGPFGAKGVGEAGVPPTGPAIANAIFSISGVRIRELPLTPERVFWALKSSIR